jgi:hypothetical protein
MTSSATSTERAAHRDTGFQPWHFFVLLSMIGATAAVMLARDTHPVALLLLSAAVIASGLVGLAVHYTLQGFFGRQPGVAPLKISDREALERDKALVLRSIKELEFDRAMGKVGERDYNELSGRLRARALALMERLERQRAPGTSGSPATRGTGAPGTGTPDGPAEPGTCGSCGTANDADARFCKHCGARIAAAIALILALVGAPAMATAQGAMPNPKEMSGMVLPVTDVPAGTVTVRVIRGSFDKPVVDHPVEFTIDAGEPRAARTDASGRAQVSGLRPGARVRAVTTVDGERLESQEAVVAQSGLRIMLVAADPDAAARAAEDKALAGAPPAKGMVVLGPESRVVAQLADDQLNIFYGLEILNSARVPVDIGGPLIFDLPRDARGTTVMEGSTKQATASGPRVTVTGPFAPGTTPVEIGFVLPYGGDTARLVQRWPAALQQTTVLVMQTGGLAIASPQVAQKRDLSSEGQAIILGSGPGIPAGQTLELQITGLPSRPLWPRYLAVSLAAIITLAGLWAAATARPSTRVA